MDHDSQTLDTRAFSSVFTYRIGQIYNQIGLMLFACVMLSFVVVGAVAPQSGSKVILGLIMSGAGVSTLALGAAVYRGFFANVTIDTNAITIKRPFSTTKCSLAEAERFVLDKCVIRPGYVVRLHCGSAKPVRTSFIALNGRLASSQNDAVKALVKTMNTDLLERQRTLLEERR